MVFLLILSLNQQDLLLAAISVERFHQPFYNVGFRVKSGPSNIAGTQLPDRQLSANSGPLKQLCLVRRTNVLFLATLP
jgi:hypothetical protein